MKRLAMSERRVWVKAFAAQYRKATKKEKGAILDRFIEATGYKRHYAARLLCNQGRRVRLGPRVVLQGEVSVRWRRGRERRYGPEVKGELMKLWRMLDYVCGKRLAAALPRVLEALERHGELAVSGEVRQALVSVSASTIDRLLKEDKRKLQLKGRARTRPGTLLKHQIPVRTFSDWEEGRPGFVEMDLVAHEGGRAQGDYLQTLDLTDVATGWIELEAVLNKAQVWVFEALQRIRQRLPFPLLGVDSDNGAEFINHHMKAYCESEKITFTRSRPYRKNDNCFVEQKNYSVVRRFAGYDRYQGAEDLRRLNELYRWVRLYVNFFMPSQKLREKGREGSRVWQRYDPAKTPYQRVLDSTEVSAQRKRRLRAQYLKLNPAALHRRIERLQRALTDRPRRRPLPSPEDTAETHRDGSLPALWKTPSDLPPPPPGPSKEGLPRCSSDDHSQSRSG